MRNTVGCLTQEDCTKWLSTALELGTSVGGVHEQSLLREINFGPAQK